MYWLKHHRGVYHTGLVCSEPEEFRGWSVEDYVKTYNGECPKDLQFGQTVDPAGITAQELIAETEEEELGPGPYRGPKKYEIIRLTWGENCDAGNTVVFYEQVFGKILIESEIKL